MRVSNSLHNQFNISDFCDMDQFERVICDWARGTGLASVAIDYRRKVHRRIL